MVDSEPTATIERKPETTQHHTDRGMLGFVTNSDDSMCNKSLSCHLMRKYPLFLSSDDAIADATAGLRFEDEAGSKSCMLVPLDTGLTSFQGFVTVHGNRYQVSPSQRLRVIMVLLLTAMPIIASSSQYFDRCRFFFVVCRRNCRWPKDKRARGRSRSWTSRATPR